jgi:DNA invertase Pin-like site-specific DNA recombinase
LQQRDVPLVRKLDLLTRSTRHLPHPRNDQRSRCVHQALDEPIIDTTSDNMRAEAFVTFDSTFAAIEREMILMRERELKGDGEWC